MNASVENEQEHFESWLASERLFMRFAGFLLLLIAVSSIFTGVLNNPNNERVLSIFNIVVTLACLFGGIWEIYRSMQDEPMNRMVRHLVDQEPRYVRLMSIIQIIVAIPFLLEALSGNLTLLLLALMLCINAGWLSRRYRRIRYHQTMIYGN